MCVHSALNEITGIHVQTIYKGMFVSTIRKKIRIISCYAMFWLSAPKARTGEDAGEERQL
jgi:hypothetical protein